MPYKDPEVRKSKHKEYSREHYLKTQEETKQRTKENKAQLRAEWRVFKGTLKCTKCGENHPAALDFHHEDPATKDREVSWFIKNSQFTKAIEEGLAERSLSIDLDLDLGLFLSFLFSTYLDLFLVKDFYTGASSSSKLS